MIPTVAENLEAIELKQEDGILKALLDFLRPRKVQPESASLEARFLNRAIDTSACLEWTPGCRDIQDILRLWKMKGAELDMWDPRSAHQLDTQHSSP